MPTIASFGACKITMYPDDHPPPHFHVLAPAWHATFTIRGRRHLRGRFRRKDTREALEWAAENEEKLMARWTELNEREE